MDHDSIMNNSRRGRATALSTRKALTYRQLQSLTLGSDVGLEGIANKHNPQILIGCARP
jgi:hypothetical protein